MPNETLGIRSEILMNSILCQVKNTTLVVEGIIVMK